MTLLGALLVGAPASGGSQVVRGTVTEADSGLPLEGALVTVVAAEGDSAVAGVLTSASGSFALRPSPGRWRLRTELIGHATVLSDPFVLATGDVVIRHVRSPVSAVPLEGLAVTGASRGCVVRPTEGAATAAAWEEARKALENAYWGRERELLRFETVVYQRRLDPSTLRVEEERAERRRGMAARPFQSLPPQSLARDGFVQRTDSGTYYHAPDEAVLLSDVFLDHHCFRLRRDESRPELLGLAFEPTRGTSQVDISGVLWLDARTGELRWLEFGYRNLDLDVSTEDVGGYVQFQRLPTGAWIPRRWWIRMPVVELRHIRRMGFEIERPVLAGLRENGGEVVAVETGDSVRLEDLDRPRVTGIVWDSAQARALEGAEVFLVGTDRRTRTGPDGRFLLAAVEGDFLLAFHHPRADSLGFQPPPRGVAMREGVVRHVQLALPSEESVLLSACGPRGGRAAVVGVVRGPDGEPLGGARVGLGWDGAAEVQGWAETRSDGRGRYAFCELPTGVRAATVRATSRGRVSEPVELELPQGRALRADVGVDSLRTGRVTGRVTDATSGQPVPGIVVRVRQTGLGTATDAQGRFGFLEVPPGRRILDFEHEVLDHHADSIEVPPGGAVTLEAHVDAHAIALEPLTVTAERYRTPGLNGFFERMESGLGRYVTAEEIELRQTRQLSEVLRAIPGLGIGCNASGVTASGCFYAFERARRLDDDVCPVQFFLDGSATAQEIIEAVPPGQIRGIEAYNGLSNVPPQFRRGPDTRCGVVAVWLKDGG